MAEAKNTKTVAPGNNEFVFNEATMIKAMQHYLDTVALREGHGLEVVAVTPKLGDAGRHEKSFTVKVTERTSAG